MDAEDLTVLISCWRVSGYVKLRVPTPGVAEHSLRSWELQELAQVSPGPVQRLGHLVLRLLDTFGATGCHRRAENGVGAQSSLG